MSAIINNIIHYGKQPSTWRGASILLGAFGVYVSPEMTDLITTTAVGALGLIEVIRNEPSKEE